MTRAIMILALATLGCDRTETSTARITTTSPARTSAAPSGAEAAGRNEALVRVVHAIPGRFYTLVIVGSGRSTPTLEAFLIEDAPTP